MSRCLFYLGTHQPHWLGRHAVPMFVSRRTLAERRSLPRALARWALDSGGFTELSMHGRWTVTPGRYVEEVRRFRDEVGLLDWAAIQDWMCEPWILQKTGRSIAAHQRLSVESLLTLRSLAPDLPWAPVLQGWEGDDYLRHVEMYDAAGVNLLLEPIVGVGSVCRRQHTAEAEVFLSRLAALGLRLHGFGFKVLGLKKSGAHLASSDSLAWSLAARRKPPMPECVAAGETHRNCANCARFAMSWRERVLNVLGQRRYAETAVRGWKQWDMFTEAA